MSVNLKQSGGVPRAKGKLAVLTPGMGAVATTLYAGVEAVKQGWARPVGSFTQMGKMKLARHADSPVGSVNDLVSIAALDDLVFGGWDIFEDSAYESALHAEVLEKDLVHKLKDQLSAIKPMKAVFDRNFIKRIDGPHVKKGANKMELADQLRQDIRDFMKTNGCDRAVLVWCASTEVYAGPSEVHRSLEAFEKGLRDSDPRISPSQIYAYASLMERVPYANGSPNLSVEMPCIHELSLKMETPICGSDFKTGQTLMKTIIAPGLRNRQLGVAGWFSTNILGNRDGEVLDDPGSFKSKEVSKSGVLSTILSPDVQPDLYTDMHHQIKINYYKPRKDNKESWDNIDIFGWLGYPMQIKINFLCRDSILAAPIVLDLALFMDLAGRAKLKGIQEWLSFYFKAPLPVGERPVEHDFFAQMSKLEDMLRGLSALNTQVGVPVQAPAAVHAARDSAPHVA